jgi:succinate dehydrogenase flavin-adding protein (antitoxin of CptAB toxin-antitoxin module)
MDSVSLHRLKWKCRRGLLELDIVLERFLSTQATSLSDEELARLSELLETGDNELWDIVIGRSEQFDLRHHDLIERLRAA